MPGFQFRNDFASTDPVICHPDNLQIGEMIVDLGTASTWNPRPAWHAQKCARFDHCGPLLIHALEELAPANSLAALVIDLPEPPSKTEAAILQTARSAAAQLIAGLGRTSPDSLSEMENAIPTRRWSTHLCIPQHTLLESGITGLAGLGIGATPAGDDWLVGGMLALWSRLPDAEAKSLGERIAETAAPRTTPLSAAWLYAAARGECHEDWHALLDSIHTGDEAAIQAATATLIRHGHTSGADALTGFFMILTL